MEVNTFKKDFPIFENEPNLVYLDNAATTQKPQAVIDAVANFYSHDNSNIHRGVYKLSQKATEAYEQARQKVAQFINAGSADEIIFTRSATEAINLVAATFGALKIGKNDRILITEMEHHANLVPWQLLAAKKGAKLCIVPIQDDGSLDLKAFEERISPDTKLIAFPHISNTLGTVNNAKAIIKLAHANNIPVLVDGAQAIPHMKVDVQDLDADFYAFSGHKLYVPTGIGVLYAKKQWLEEMPPYQSGGDMIESVSFEETTFAKAPAKFEAGTPNIAGAIGLSAAVDYLSGIGMDIIANHEAELTAYAKEQLKNIEGLRFIGEAPHQAGIISFVLEGIHPHDIGTILDQDGIAIRTGHHCTQPLMKRFDVPATSRLSFGLYNSKEDIDKAVASLQKAISLLK